MEIASSGIKALADLAIQERGESSEARALPGPLRERLPLLLLPLWGYRAGKSSHSGYPLKISHGTASLGCVCPAAACQVRRVYTSPREHGVNNLEGVYTRDMTVWEYYDRMQIALFGTCQY